MDYKDYYQTLGVPRSAGEDEIRKAYRKLAKQYHPDRNRGNREAEEKFKEINEAYEVLSDPQKKARYDHVGNDYQQWQRSGAQSGFDWSQYAGGMPQGGTRVEFSDLGDLFGGGFSDFFQSIFGDIPIQQSDSFRRGQRGRPETGRASARNLPDVDVAITLEEAFRGSTRIVQIGNRRLEVKIPVGAGTGTRIRLAGEGGAGDLFLKIQVTDDPRWERREDDLSTEIPVDVMTMILGRRSADGDDRRKIHPVENPARNKFRTVHPVERTGDAPAAQSVDAGGFICESASGNPHPADRFGKESVGGIRSIEETSDLIR